MELVGVDSAVALPSFDTVTLVVMPGIISETNLLLHPLGHSVLEVGAAVHDSRGMHPLRLSEKTAFSTTPHPSFKVGVPDDAAGLWVDYCAGVFALRLGTAETSTEQVETEITPSRD